MLNLHIYAYDMLQKSTTYKQVYLCSRHTSPVPRIHRSLLDTQYSNLHKIPWDQQLKNVQMNCGFCYMHFPTSYCGSRSILKILQISLCSFLTKVGRTCRFGGVAEVEVVVFCMHSFSDCRVAMEMFLCSRFLLLHDF